MDIRPYPRSFIAPEERAEQSIFFTLLIGCRDRRQGLSSIRNAGIQPGVTSLCEGIGFQDVGGGEGHRIGAEVNVQVRSIRVDAGSSEAQAIPPAMNTAEYRTKLAANIG